MTIANVEILLAQLYTDQKFLNAFLNNPESTIGSGFSDAEKTSILMMDKDDLVMAAHSFQHKRDEYKKK